MFDLGNGAAGIFGCCVPYGVCWMIGPDIEVGEGYQ